MKDPEDEAFEELSLKQGQWEHTSGWRKKQILETSMTQKALAEHAMQEPVAHCKVRPLRGDESFPKVEIDWVNQPVPGPLYAAPPQRKPLTEEQIFALENSIPDEIVSDRDWCIHFARAIEAKLKENT